MMIAHHRRHPARVALLALALGVAGCGQAAPSAIPASSSVSPAAAQSPESTISAAPGRSLTASATPATVPTVSAAPSAASSAVPCAVRPQSRALPSDRLTGMQVLGLPGKDIIRFEFGTGSLTPAGSPVGSLAVAVPPFSQGASGQLIDLDGQHALKLVFTGMSLANDVGQPTFTGDREIRSGVPSRSLRHVILFDESEGQSGWYVGYDGPTCVSLSREGDAVLLAIEFSPSP